MEIFLQLSVLSLFYAKLEKGGENLWFADFRMTATPTSMGPGL